MKKLLLSTTITLLPVVAGPAYAATSSTTLDVSAVVGLTCTVTTSPVNFGTVDPTVGASTTGDVSVSCPIATPYNIALNDGLNYTGSWRAISDGVNTLEYALLDPATGLEWGDSDYAATYNWGTSVAGTGTGGIVVHLINATLNPAAPVPDGLYSDIVNVTVHY